MKKTAFAKRSMSVTGGKMGYYLHFIRVHQTLREDDLAGGGGNKMRPAVRQRSNYKRAQLTGKCSAVWGDLRNGWD